MGITDEMRKIRERDRLSVAMSVSNATPDPRFPQTVVINDVEYAHVPGAAFGRAKGLYVATRKHSDYARQFPASWVQAKRLAQEEMAGGVTAGRMPTNFEWSRARKYAQLYFPGLEKDMITNPKEWVDLLVDFGEDYHNRMPPIAVTDTAIEGSAYKITGGVAKQLPWLPRQSGDVCEWDNEEELPVQIGKDSHDKFQAGFFSVIPVGMRVVARGEYTDGKPEPGARFSVTIDNFPNDADRFGPTFRVVVDEDKVKI
ncbi:MAG: hypothetical protein HYS53_00610 [Candidatus Aenigmarchaeota archaeon]|nr:hypothetical protein [Candidatus Aenigmarchaeota archaeon]